MDLFYLDRVIYCGFYLRFYLTPGVLDGCSVSRGVLWGHEAVRWTPQGQQCSYWMSLVKMKPQPCVWESETLSAPSQRLVWGENNDWTEQSNLLCCGPQLSDNTSSRRQRTNYISSVCRGRGLLSASAHWQSLITCSAEGEVAINREWDRWNIGVHRPDLTSHVLLPGPVPDDENSDLNQKISIWESETPAEVVMWEHHAERSYQSWAGGIWFSTSKDHNRNYNLVHGCSLCL